MSIIIFLIILSALVLVHEFGHYFSARLFGIRVDEFGLGYPPRAKTLFRRNETDFTLNWLPFGGFVKIFGENPSEENAKSRESFQSKNRGIQASVLVSGVVGNFLFAWFLISLGLMTGLPAPAGVSLPVENPKTVFTAVLPGLPADEAGIKAGDVLVSINGLKFTTEEASDLISRSSHLLSFKIERGKNAFDVTLAPESGIIPDRNAIGVEMDSIGVVHLPLYQAFIKGLSITWQLTLLTAKLLGSFISQALVGRADLSAVTGPVGLVGMVGDVSVLGFSHLLVFTALISINLCLINLLPFPALDGGRLLFVGIEAITRRPISPRIFNALNSAGFALLVFLMILITIRDVRNIF